MKIYKNKESLIADLIKRDDLVLDVGFWGQGVGPKDDNWVHKLLLAKAKKYKESPKKKVLNGLYKILPLFTPKFVETLIIVARKT